MLWPVVCRTLYATLDFQTTFLFALLCNMWALIQLAVIVTWCVPPDWALRILESGILPITASLMKSQSVET